MKHLPLLFFLLMISSCARRSDSQKDLVDISLFISMPRNNLVHENFAPDLYQSLWHQCARHGFDLSNQKDADYHLDTTHIDVRMPHKFISPDLVLYGRTMRFEVRCCFTGPGMKTLTRSFVSLALLSSPKNPMLSSHFKEHEIKKLFKKLSVKVTQWMISEVTKQKR